MVEHVMSNVLDEIIQELDTPSFQDNLRRSRELSYFAQISSRRKNGVFRFDELPAAVNSSNAGQGQEAVTAAVVPLPVASGFNCEQDDGQSRQQMLFDEAVIG
jgi:hypothetical protein